MTKSATRHLRCQGRSGGRTTVSAHTPQWAEANGFTGQPAGCWRCRARAGIFAYLFGIGTEPSAPLLCRARRGGLAGWTLSARGRFGDPTLAALGFRLGAYRFDRYSKGSDRPELELPEGADVAEIERAVTRGLPRPRPHQHAGQRSRPRCVRRLDPDFARDHKMKLTVILGDDLLAEFPDDPRRRPRQRPGAASARSELGRPRHPKVTLVGKGVTFDTGGLDIKPDVRCC